MNKQNIKNLRKGIGKIGAQLLSALSEKNMEVFTISEAEKASGRKGPRLRKLLHDLAKNNWIIRIERGKYLIISLESSSADYKTHPFIIAKNLITPYYLGFFSALNYHGISEQVSNKLYIATTKKKKSLHFQNIDFIFVTLPKKRFFGATEEWIGNLKLKVSDKEKTIIDCLFMPEYSKGLTEVAKAFRENMDYEKMYEYAIRMEDLATIKKLGYLLDALKINTLVTKKLLNDVAGGYCLLDSNGPKTGLKNKKWRIIENISKKELMIEI